MDYQKEADARADMLSEKMKGDFSFDKVTIRNGTITTKVVSPDDVELIKELYIKNLIIEGFKDNNVNLSYEEVELLEEIPNLLDALYKAWKMIDTEELSDIAHAVNLLNSIEDMREVAS